MGGLSASSSATVFGTNVAPVSFPGIASGIDYNSIIAKYSDITLAQEKPLQTKVTSLNAQNAELLKIQNLISKFQDTFQAVSDPANFNSVTPSSTNTTVLNATAVSGQTATPGTYVVTNATLATSTQITNDAAANGPFDPTATLAKSGSSITANNGPIGSTNPKGQVTINGVAISYDVNADTLNAVLNRINTNATLSAQGVTASYSGGKFTLSSTAPLTLGSGSDQGNLLQVLKVDTAPIVGNSVTSATAIGGINLGTTFNAVGNAGFATAVTSGSFSINGVVFKIDNATNNLSDVLTRINQSSAGVVASYDQANDKIQLTSKTAGPQGIVLGGAGDTSNFLQSAGFLQNYTTQGALSAGASQVVGHAAVVSYIDAGGSTHTAYSNSNDVTNVIPGVDLTLRQQIGAGYAAPVTVSVAQDTTALTTAIGNWTKAYNAVLDEINTATQAPAIGSSTSKSTGQQTATQLTTGGVLFNNQDVLSMRDQLVSLVSGFGATNSTSYNSFASIGLVLDSSFSVTSASAANAQNSSNQTSTTTQTFAGTSGKLQDLNLAKFTAALAANSNAVAALFTGTTSVVGRIGAYLTSATGLPTQLTSGLAGKIPTQSLFSTLTASTSDQITSLQDQIKLVTDQVNLQANSLRAEFASSEGKIAQLQSLQSSLAGFFKGSG